MPGPKPEYEIALTTEEDPMHVPHRYEREGALHLFSGLSVANGQVYGQCYGRKRFADFQAFLLQVSSFLS